MKASTLKLDRRNFSSYAVGIYLTTKNFESLAIEVPNKNILRNYKILKEDFEINQLSINPPPIDNKIEAGLVLDFKKLRTQKTLKNIFEEDRNFINIFLKVAQKNGCILSSDVEIKLTQAIADVTDVVLYFKNLFDRPRPNEIIPAINPVLPVPNFSAYPGGHATQAKVAADLLVGWGAKVNEKYLYQYAKEVARNREIAGLHYPSDSIAGNELGKQLSKIILKGSLA